ncbi:MAG: acetoacetate decarboxylase family protein [Proteobacteria bacterium]|nr:acetoacetate decarboxylase family protein [Pseudomonadota bacterium]MCP4920801.1 acetoacetate decarboxylase family protein [Pseudomonadota bacterium]
MDLVLVQIPAPDELVAGAIAEGLHPLGHDALLCVSGWHDFGALGRSTSYDELTHFLPCREGVLFCDELVLSSAAGVLVGRELFGFPKGSAPRGWVSERPGRSETIASSP